MRVPKPKFGLALTASGAEQNDAQVIGITIIAGSSAGLAR
jgi:hypothetical protein